MWKEHLGTLKLLNPKAHDEFFLLCKGLIWRFRVHGGSSTGLSLFVCLCMCVYIYIYVYVCICIYIYIYMYVYIYIYVYTGLGVLGFVWGFGVWSFGAYKASEWQHRVRRTARGLLL